MLLESNFKAVVEYAGRRMMCARHCELRSSEANQYYFWVASGKPSQ